MTEDGKPRNFPVRWDGEDFARIEQAAARLNERDHTDHTPTDVIRMGTRRFVEEILAETAAA
jgi:hypothetical protein